MQRFRDSLLYRDFLIFVAVRVQWLGLFKTTKSVIAEFSFNAFADQSDSLKQNAVV